MDKETATNLLATELAKHAHISIIREEWDKKNIITDSYYYMQAGNPFLLNYQYLDDSNDMMRYQDDMSRQAKGWCFSHEKRAEEGNHAYYSSLEKAVMDQEECIGANYFLVQDIIRDKKEHASGTLPHISHFFVTPYSIIGKKEDMQCRQLFYKDVHPEILCAIETLEIPNYIHIYEEYKNLIKYLDKIGMQYKYDLYDNLRDEILLGLFSRVLNLYLIFAFDCATWASALSSAIKLL